MTVSTPTAPAALRARLGAVLAERDRNFPRRDPANTREMRAALAEYVAVLAATGDPVWRPDPARLAEARAMGEAPVVVCGFMKSGTTLLVELLDDHPALVVLPGDSHMMNAGENRRRREERAAYWVPVLVNPRGQAPFWYLGEDDAPYREFTGYLDASLTGHADDDRGRFLAFVQALHCANPRRAPHPRLWIEKTPENERHVAEILGWFPAARFIHMVRHPLENLASVKQLFRQRGWRWKRWSAAATARKLAVAIAVADRQRARLGAARYHVLRYEDLVADVGGRMREVARFLDVPWHDTLLAPTINGAPSQPNSMYRERLGVRGQVFAGTAERWRTELTAAERVVASVILRPVCRRWGYG